MFALGNLGTFHNLANRISSPIDSYPSSRSCVRSLTTGGGDFLDGGIIPPLTLAVDESDDLIIDASFVRKISSGAVSA